MISVSIDGGAELAKEFRSAAASLKRNNKIIKKSFKRYHDMTGQVFDAEGSAWGGRHWASLSPKQIGIRKAAGKGSHPILNFRGALRSAATSGSGGGEKITAKTTIQDNVGEMVLGGYKVLNQIPETGNLPARPFLLMSEEMVDEIEKIWEEWLGTEVLK